MKKIFFKIFSIFSFNCVENIDTIKEIEKIEQINNNNVYLFLGESIKKNATLLSELYALNCKRKRESAVLDLLKLERFSNFSGVFIYLAKGHGYIWKSAIVNEGKVFAIGEFKEAEGNILFLL